MQKTLLKLIINKDLKKYFNKEPKNISDIYLMVNKVKNYLKKNEKIFN